MSPQAAILLVEDDDIDAELLQLALEEAGSTRPVHRARDGLEALAMLRGEAGQPPLARPFLLVSDLRMPRMGGIEFLAELRADPKLADLPVFVLSTSTAAPHKRQAYAHKALAYITKSDDAARVRRLARLIEDYCEIVELP